MHAVAERSEPAVLLSTHEAAAGNGHRNVSHWEVIPQTLLLSFTLSRWVIEHPMCHVCVCGISHLLG